MKQKWENELKDERRGVYVTDYQIAYTGHPKEAFPRRYASAPKYLSSHFNPINKVWKSNDMIFKCVMYLLFMQATFNS